MLNWLFSQPHATNFDNLNRDSAGVVAIYHSIVREYAKIVNHPKCHQAGCVDSNALESFGV